MTFPGLSQEMWALVAPELRTEEDFVRVPYASCGIDIDCSEVLVHVNVSIFWSVFILKQRNIYIFI